MKMRAFLFFNFLSLFSSTHSWAPVIKIDKRWVATSSSASTAGGEQSPIATAKEKIRLALKPAHLSVTSTHDDPNGSHISITVVSEMFEGVSRVKRQVSTVSACVVCANYNNQLDRIRHYPVQQMVYKSIWEEMQGAIHAVDSMVCKTPSEV